MGHIEERHTALQQSLDMADINLGLIQVKQFFGVVSEHRLRHQQSIVLGLLPMHWVVSHLVPKLLLYVVEFIVTVQYRLFPQCLLNAFLDLYIGQGQLVELVIKIKPTGKLLPLGMGTKELCNELDRIHSLVLHLVLESIVRADRAASLVKSQALRLELSD
jgi:hypothetical protein